MKTLIVCRSYHHGNTWKVAETIGGVLNAEIVTPVEKRPSSIRDYDFLDLGSGIYWALGTLMNANQNLLEGLGVSSPGLRKLIKAAGRSGSIGAELTGSGGGDRMIALTGDKMDEIENRIKAEGRETTRAKIGVEGF